jgi:quinol monooxygenase YgiN
MSVNAVVVLKTKDDMRNGFTEIMKASKPKLLAAEGCLSVDMYQDHADPNTFVLIEEWVSEEKHKQYFGSLIESGEWESMSQHLATSPDSRYCAKL